MTSMVCKYSSISDTPRFERLTVVRIFLSTISLVMITSPACSRFVSSTDRFPLLSPVTRCRKTKQFQGLLAFTRVTTCRLTKSPYATPLHRRLGRPCCLHRRFDCYRVERSSSRAGLSPRCGPAPFHGAL